ncbi:MAG TPA: DMT family transporter [Gemmatimonadaceae bacterium]|nr:DMT family transporter [Gemmatimonadaceae bacterium]
MASTLETSLAPGRADAARRPGVSATDALLLLMSVLWGVNYVVVKYGTGVLAPEAYNGARIALATVAFVGLARVRREPRVARRDLLALLALGVLGNGLYQWLFAEGVAHTSAGSAALVLAASPALIALIGHLSGVERVHARGYAGIALSMVGIALVVLGYGSGAGHHATLAGNVITLAGALCWAVYTVLLQPYTKRVSLVNISALTLVGGMLPLLVVSAPALHATNWAAVRPATWAAIVYSGIGSLVLGYLFWYRGVRVLGPTRTAIYSNLQPAIALAAAWAALGEVPTPLQGVGAATIIAGVILTRT